MTHDTETEPHVPSADERAARDRVREQATGLSHHEVEAALEAAEAAAGDLDRADDRTVAAVVEWQRIADLLFDHGGPYSPDADAYVQGQLAARRNHRP
ncbi:hypothetical protein [Streptomyces sp. NPDC051183]|uniref:hypothetical protein n=1 Tax=unclassified Streptomyces TaxID=2593676 RepID=UPI003434585D